MAVLSTLKHHGSYDRTCLIYDNLCLYITAHIPGVVFFFVTANVVSENATRNDWPSRFTSAQTISGTRSHHSFLRFLELSCR